jgi:hypothetical protein
VGIVPAREHSVFSWIGVIETHGQCTILPRSGGGMHSVDEISAERG